ncbi:MAG: hypothetical protein ACYCX3_07120 [Thermoleophilia bacterium]
MRRISPRPAARIACGLLLGAGLTMLVFGCAATSSVTEDHSVGLSSAAPSAPSATATSAAEPTQHVSVVHPYHSEYLDAPNYLLPTEITLAPGFSLPEFPSSVPAQKIASEHLPDTDLSLLPSPVRVGGYSWRLDAAEDPTGKDVTLGAQDVAVERARAFLNEHGLWDTSYGEPEVRIGSRDSGPDGEFITSWLVRFPGEVLAGGMEKYASLRVGHENRVVGLTLFIPRLEVLPDRFIRLRPVAEVVQDLRAWQSDGHPSNELQNGIQGEVIVEIMNVTLAYEDPGSGGDPLAVPVYLFEVAVSSGEGATYDTGTWSVVAAADVEARVFR